MFYLVTAKCGHVGNGLYVEKSFPVISDSRSEAAKKVLSFPRVKKQLKNAITSVINISKEDYEKYMDINSDDPYLTAKCHRDLIGENLFLKEIERPKKRKIEFDSREEKVFFKLKKYQLKEAGLYEYAY